MLQETLTTAPATAVPRTPVTASPAARASGPALTPGPVPLVPWAPATEVDDRAARRSLRAQVARLEAELCRLTGDQDRAGAPAAIRGARATGDPRVLSVGHLERVRDQLAERLAVARGERAALAAVHAANRRRVEAMMLDPAAHRFQRVSYEDIGERGCGGWEVRPRLGPIGMLMGWWRVKISSGCPLAEPRPSPRQPA